MAKERPLGKILHILGNEAICQPLTGFRGKGMKVRLDDNIIGTLGDPFGNTERPYQPVLLNNPSWHNKPIEGREVFAIYKKKKKTRYHRRNN